MKSLLVFASFALLFGCSFVTTPATTHQVVLTLFNESHDAASIDVLDPAQRTVGVATPPLVAGASHADITLQLPNTGEWRLWINHGEPGEGVIINNGDVGVACTGRIPIRIFVANDRNLSWSGQPVC